MWRIEYSKQARKALASMPRYTARTIRAKLVSLSENPNAPNNNVKKLMGRPGFRLRVGNWRVVYELHDDVLVVLVLDVSPRGGAYQ